MALLREFIKANLENIGATKMPFFRKKPVVIEAWCNDGTADGPSWIGGIDVVYETDGSISIKTLEGIMVAQLGDWIIKGVKGEIYPCKPDIFIATYDPTIEPLNR